MERVSLKKNSITSSTKVNETTNEQVSMLKSMVKVKTMQGKKVPKTLESLGSVSRISKRDHGQNLPIESKPKQ
jgi:hypothetical protein